MFLFFICACIWARARLEIPHQSCHLCVFPSLGCFRKMRFWWCGCQSRSIPAKSPPSQMGVQRGGGNKTVAPYLEWENYAEINEGINVTCLTFCCWNMMKKRTVFFFPYFSCNPCCSSTACWGAFTQQCASVEIRELKIALLNRLSSQLLLFHVKTVGLKKLNYYHSNHISVVALMKEKGNDWVETNTGQHVTTRTVWSVCSDPWVSNLEDHV